VLASFAVGPFPMALVFNGFEIGAIFLAVFIAQEVTQRGDSTWFEGLQLLVARDPGYFTSAGFWYLILGWS
jgi:Ca2+:H+ antiporter